MYFDACKSLEELKRAYKKLALENHPDMGGNVDVMKAINCEYDRTFERLKHRRMLLRLNLIQRLRPQAKRRRSSSAS